MRKLPGEEEARRPRNAVVHVRRLVLEPGDDRAGVEPVRVHALLLHERQPRGREVGGVEAAWVPAEALHVAPVDEHDADARPSQGVLHAERRIRKRRRRLIGVITRR